ncbi:glycoside hydrolase family 19 protein [Nocardia farcinica]|uniref:glycoside hydrolase family 19 protein n=1 Tax=Nocardia farcinica TaxID=37329 RepID=UPI0037BD11E2
MGHAVPEGRYAELAPAFNAALLAADCTTVDRVAMFCAQLGHESGGLRWMEEIADGSAYEWRQDLGNVFPGDGRRYKGRGPIQVTGRHNYARLSEWAHARGLCPTPTFFVDHPHELASDRYGFVGVVWYWTAARDMNAYADARDIHGATRAVNGGLNGIADRIRRWNLCRALGDALLPTEGDAMSAADDELTKRFPSRSKYRENDEPVDTAVGFILNIDARIHEEHVEREALKGVPWAVELVKREAAKGDEGARAVLAQIEGSRK